jgi:phosphoribosylformimino-5-aminoimidazole carboxamide ribotide isomerase
MFPTAMLLIPAIDMKDGQCVRLKQGDMDQTTVFGEDPAACRQRLGQQRRAAHPSGGSEWCVRRQSQKRSGHPRILKEVGQTKSMSNSAAASATWTPSSATWMRVCATSSSAPQRSSNPGFLQDACTAFGGHIIVGLDAKDGKVATDGWSKLTGHDVVDLGKKFEDYGVESIIYTDIGRDGMLSGINIEATVKLAQALTIPVIASGGLVQSG